MVKAAKVFIAGLFALFVLAAPALAQDKDGGAGERERVIVHFFDDKLCPVCREQKKFLEEISPNYPQMEFRVYPISETALLSELAEKAGVEDYRIMAPTTIIGEHFFQFGSFTDKHKEMIVGAIEGEIVAEEGLTIKIPFTGREVDLSGWSLPLLAVILGSLDGVNVCSIGALVLILSMVLVFKSRKKILVLGGLFIATTAVVYGLLVFVWGRLFDTLVGQLEILRIIVALAAFGGALYFFKEFLRFLKYGPACQVSHGKLLKGATQKLTKALNEPGGSFALLSGSIMLFAAAVTIVELPCSIGIPIAYTGILVERGVSLVSYTLYILAYIFFYMLDELIVFTGAVLTKRIWFANSKMIIWTTLAGAIILFFIAVYYLVGL